MEEEQISGYTSVIDGTTITNVHVPEVTEVTGSIVWNDDSDRDGIRPDMVGVKLLHNDTVIKTVMVTPDAVRVWRYSFDELDKYESGKAIEYTVTQNAVSGYEVCMDKYTCA